jgi:hypothetical protein
MKLLINLYKEWKGCEPVKTERITGSGSNREYYRMYDDDGHSVVGVIGTSRDENHAFIYLSNHFERRQLPVPHILAVSKDESRYIQTDLGNMSLFDAIRGGREAGGRYNQYEKSLLVKTIRELPNIQLRGARELEWSNCYPQPEFNQDSVLFDLNYFKYCFLKATELDFHELKLEANFRMLAKDLTSEPCESFLYRDFQARNIMLDADGNQVIYTYYEYKVVTTNDDGTTTTTWPRVKTLQEIPEDVRKAGDYYGPYTIKATENAEYNNFTVFEVFKDCKYNDAAMTKDNAASILSNSTPHWAVSKKFKISDVVYRLTQNSTWPNDNILVTTN